MGNRGLLLGAAIFMVAVSLPSTGLSTSSASPTDHKYLLIHGWDLLIAHTDDVYRNRDKFALTGADGVILPVDGYRANGTVYRGRNVMTGEGWCEPHFEKTKIMLREMMGLKGFKDSFALTYYSPKHRLNWSDDVAWERFAHNAALIAKVAKAAGLKGIHIDHEDYENTRQFRWRAEDGEYMEVRRIARLRGRQVFKAMLNEFPSARFLSYWFFSDPRMEIRSPGTRAACLANGNLWTEFLNGALDVLPPDARFIDGSERQAYRAQAWKDGFRGAHWETTVGTLPLVASENLPKYRSVLAVGMGQYLDPYINAYKPDFTWYFEPIGKSRLARCAENMFAAAALSDECIWVYGEKGTWIDWDVKSRDQFRYPRWESQLPGLRRVLRSAIGDFSLLRKDAKSGVSHNVVANPHCDPTAGRDIPAPFGTHSDSKGEPAGKFAWDEETGATRPGSLRLMGAGCYTFSTNNLSPGQLVFVSVKAKGAYPVVNVAWRRLGIWDWKSDCYFLATPSETDGRGWKTLEGCFSVPERADGVGLIMGGVATAASPINFDDINIYVYPLFEK